MALTRHQRNRPTVVVTGIGVVTSLGVGKDENWKRLAAGQSGIRAITRFCTEGLKTRIAGTVGFLSVEPDCSAALSERLAELAAEEATGESRLGSIGHFPGPLFLAIPPVELDWHHRLKLAAASSEFGSGSYGELLKTGRMFPAYHPRFLFGAIAEHLAERFGTAGSPISLSTACASGASAIQLGLESIRRGETDAALCVAADGSVNPESLIRFSLLSALSTQNDVPEAASKPFSKNRDGFVMAEGAGALVLESYDSAKGRGARVLGVLEGCGEMADSFHRTRSSPDGGAFIGCVSRAISDAGLSPDDVDHVNAHGTATPENDRMEYIALRAVLGERVAKVPVISNKSMIGHTLSAAGAVEAAFTVMTLIRQQLLPTINYEIPDPVIPLDVVPGHARDADIRHAVSNSFGFGGQNVSLVFGRELDLASR